MKILLIASECAPYYSTGGLADVVYGLAKEFTNRLEDVRIFVPRYRSTLTQLPHLDPVVKDLRVNLGSSLMERNGPGAYSRTSNILRSSGMPPIYFLEQDYYFGRDRIYGYPDDYERFIYFCLAALEMLGDATFRSRENDWFPGIIQGYDWATGLMPGLLRQCIKHDPRFNAVRFVLNIHNPRRMGLFGSRALQLASQDDGGFYQELGEHDERMNFLGRGVLFADKIVTVNPNFDDPDASGETSRTVPAAVAQKKSRNPLPEPARILKHALTQRLQEGDLVGIRNGIDEDEYDPARQNSNLPTQFGPSKLDERLKNKLALQQMLGFVPSERIPLFGMVSRLIPINGFQFLQAMNDKLKGLGELQLAVLAAGGPSELREMLRRWDKEQDANRPWIKSRFILDPAMARLIYAGCDIFLIPAKELPSGITQFIAMRYGTVPLVYHTGSLCDSVEDYQELRKLKSGSNSGIGFKFYEYNAEAFIKAVNDALQVYRSNDRTAWRSIQLHNMHQHFNWDQPAADYLELYQTALQTDAKPIRPGTPIRLNRENRLLQAILEVDNLPGLSARDAREILKQAGRIIRGVLRCDAIYVWDMNGNQGGEILEASLDRVRYPVEPARDLVAQLLNQGAADIWGPLGDADGSGICRPIEGLAESNLARKIGWQVGRSVPVTAHGRLLGRIDALFIEIPAHEDNEWLVMALTALASAFGQRLYIVREAKEMDIVSGLAGLLLEARSFEEAVKIILDQISKLIPVTRIWLYHQCGNDLVTTGNTEEAEIGQAPAIETVKLRTKVSFVDWIDAPRGSDGHRRFRSLLALPLLAPNRPSAVPIGALVLAHSDPGAFTQDQEQFLERRLAPQVASVLSTTGWLKERDQIRVGQLQKLSESLVAGVDFETLLQQVIDTIAELLQVRASALYLLNDKSHELEILAASGYQRVFLTKKVTYHVEKDQGLTGWIAATGEIVRVNSLQELHAHPGWRGDKNRLYNVEEPNALLGIPLQVEGRVVGVLKLEDRKEGLSQDTFSDEDVLLVRMMCNIIATVVYNAKISRQVSEQKLSAFGDSLRNLSSVLVSSQGGQTLMNSIVEKIKDVMGVDAASLFLLEDTGKRLEIRAASGYQKKLMSAEPRPAYNWGEGVTGRIASDNKPFQANSLEELRTKGGGTKGNYDHLQDNHQPQSFYGIPLNVGGEEKAIGVLKVEGLKPRAWTDEDRLLIQMMGNIIAAVVYNAESSEKKLTKLNDSLRELSRVLVGGQGRAALMHNIVEKIMHVVAVDAASLFLLDESSHRLVIQAASGYQEKLMSADPLPSYAWGEGVTGRIARDNKPFQANSLAELRTKGGGTKGNYDHLQDNQQPQSFYGIPLNVAGEKDAIGVLKVEGLQPRAWTDEDRLLIQMMGNIIAAVVYNAEISEKKLTTFSKNIQSLSGVLAPGDPHAQEWFQRIVDTISEMFTTDAATLYLKDETNERLVIAAASGYQQPLIKAKAFYEWGEGVTGRIAKTGKPFAADSLAKLREQGTSRRGKYDALQGGNLPASFYGVPLKVTGGDTPIGVLKFESLRNGFFSPETRLLIDMVARVIATFLHNTKLGEKRVREILRLMGTLSDPINCSPKVLEDYAQEPDAALMDQLAYALAEDLGNNPAKLDIEAQRIFRARSKMKSELRPAIFERTSDWAKVLHSDRAEWQYALYGAALRLNPDFAEWGQIQHLATPWISLKEAIGDEQAFSLFAGNLVAELARRVGAKIGQSGMDSSGIWYRSVLNTEHIFGEQVKETLVLLQRRGSLEVENGRLEKFSTQEHSYPVLLVFAWNTGVTKHEQMAVREHLKSRHVDIAFADISQVLRILQVSDPGDALRSVLLHQVTIVSPFITMGAVPETRFVGRDEEIKLLTHNPTKNDFAIIGNRQIGKSSLLKIVFSMLSCKHAESQSHQVLPIKIECLAVEDQEGFFHAFQVQTGYQLDENTPSGFANCMRRLRQNGPIPLLLMDEVDELLKSQAANRETLVKEWRSLAGQDVCRFMFFGSPELAQQVHNRQSMQCNFAAPLALGYLTPPDAGRVLTEPLDKLEVALEDRDAIIDEVIRLTSCHPRLVQLVGKLLVDAANKRRERQILLNDVRQIGVDGEFRSEYLKTIWGTLGPLEQIITLITPNLEYKLADLQVELARKGILIQGGFPVAPPAGSATQFTIEPSALEAALDMLGYFSILKATQDCYRLVPALLFEIVHNMPENQLVGKISENVRKLSKVSPPNNRNKRKAT